MNQGYNEHPAHFHRVQLLPGPSSNVIWGMVGQGKGTALGERNAILEAMMFLRNTPGGVGRHSALKWMKCHWYPPHWQGALFSRPVHSLLVRIKWKISPNFCCTPAPEEAKAFVLKNTNIPDKLNQNPPPVSFSPWPHYLPLQKIPPIRICASLP